MFTAMRGIAILSSWSLYSHRGIVIATRTVRNLCTRSVCFSLCFRQSSLELVERGGTRKKEEGQERENEEEEREREREQELYYRGKFVYLAQIAQPERKSFGIKDADSNAPMASCFWQRNSQLFRQLLYRVSATHVQRNFFSFRASEVWMPSVSLSLSLSSSLARQRSKKEKNAITMIPCSREIRVIVKGNLMFRESAEDPCNMEIIECLLQYLVDETSFYLDSVSWIINPLAK